MTNDLAVIGPEEVLEALTKKLIENGFKEKTPYLLFGAPTLYIKKDYFYITGGSLSLSTYDVLEDWDYLSSLIPEEPEPQFSEEDWVWARSSVDDKALVKWTENKVTYGFGLENKWTNNFSLHNDNPLFSLSFKKASKKEVEDRLEKEARERGFIKGAIADNSDILYEGGKYKINTEDYELRYYFIINSVSFLVDNHVIMENGKWAEVIENKKPLFNGFSLGTSSCGKIKDKEFKFNVSPSGKITSGFSQTNPTFKIDLNKYDVTINKTKDNILTINTRRSGYKCPEHKLNVKGHLFAGNNKNQTAFFSSGNFFIKEPPSYKLDVKHPVKLKISYFAKNLENFRGLYNKHIEVTSLEEAKEKINKFYETHINKVNKLERGWKINANFCLEVEIASYINESNKSLIEEISNYYNHLIYE